MKKETIERLLNAYAYVIDMMNDDATYEGHTEELIYLRNTIREVLLEATCNGLEETRAYARGGTL